MLNSVSFVHVLESLHPAAAAAAVAGELCPGRTGGGLVADEPVEFEELPVEVGDFGKFRDHVRGIY